MDMKTRGVFISGNYSNQRVRLETATGIGQEHLREKTARV